MRIKPKNFGNLAGVREQFNVANFLWQSFFKGNFTRAYLHSYFGGAEVARFTRVLYREISDSEKCSSKFQDMPC